MRRRKLIVVAIFSLLLKLLPNWSSPVSKCWERLLPLLDNKLFEVSTPKLSLKDRKRTGPVKIFPHVLGI